MYVDDLMFYFHAKGNLGAERFIIQGLSMRMIAAKFWGHNVGQSVK